MPERAPLLSSDQRRELGGFLAIGAGVVAAAILAMPGSGSVAGPVHDRLTDTFGAGAWLLAAAMLLVGVRLLGRRGWTGGLLAAIGSLATALSVLGLLGLIDDTDAGSVGRVIGHGLSSRLGDAAAGLALMVATAMGLVLAVNLRAGRLMELAREVYIHHREAAAAAAEAPALVQTRDGIGARGRLEPAGAPLDEPVIPVTGRRRARTIANSSGPVTAEPELLPVVGLDLDLPPPLADPPVEEAPEPIPSGVEPFHREFEGLPVDPGDPAAVKDAAAAAAEVATAEAALEVAGHATDAAEEEPEKVWVLPSAELLEKVTGKRERLEQEIRATIATIESTLTAFGVEARVRGVNSGPTVTQYELQPAKGVPVRKITGYQTDLSLALAAPIRIQAPIPGKAAIGLEVPNKSAQLVTLRDIVTSSPFLDSKSRLTVALGADVSGHPVVGDLARMPHLLIAGATGSGKSVCINAVLAGFLLQASPAEVKMILIDPKRVELSGFADIPHLLVPVVVEPEAAVASLRWAVKEMEERYKLFAANGARNISAFNDRAPGIGLDPLPFIIIVIDELADLMMVAAGEIEDLICRIAQLARAVGIHLIVATQRPSADIITGLIKANIPSRIAFAVSSGVDSRVILDEMGAEKLLGRGDMLYLPIDEGKSRRLQGAYVSDRELERLIEHWKAQGLPTYQEEIFQVEATATWAKDATKRDPLFAKAAHTVAAEGRAAASLLQRKLNVGYTRAARLVDQLAEYRIVGPYEGSKSRDVLMGIIEVDELLAELGEE